MNEILQDLLATDSSNINRNANSRPPLSSTGFGARSLIKTKILELKLVSVFFYFKNDLNCHWPISKGLSSHLTERSPERERQFGAILSIKGKAPTQFLASSHL